MSLLLLLGGSGGATVSGTLAGPSSSTGSLTRFFPAVTPYTIGYLVNGTRFYPVDCRRYYDVDHRVAHPREAP